MTGTDIAVVIAACGAFVTSVTAAAIAWCGVLVSKRNASVLQQVKTQTDGLSKRAEDLAGLLGESKGKAVGLEQGRAEPKP
jgi:hypothetical protein